MASMICVPSESLFVTRLTAMQCCGRYLSRCLPLVVCVCWVFVLTFWFVRMPWNKAQAQAALAQRIHLYMRVYKCWQPVVYS